MNAQETIMRDLKNREKIVDHTQDPDYKSPLEIFIQNNCEQCSKFKVVCRLEDSRGLTPMSLCIALACNQPPNVGEILKQAAAQAAATTGKIAQNTLEELPEVEQP
jgi:hypothetical protein